MTAQGPLPLIVVTGFLGSGKTTLVKRLLADPRLGDSAVVVNEFGEEGLDHLLLERLEGETLLLQSGCLCCALRGDLARTLADLWERRARGLVPAFGRVILETTGLADPVPVLATVLREPVLRHHFAPGRVVATVDAVNGMRTLDEAPEAVRQVQVADRLAITKCDLTTPEVVEALAARLARLNPAAQQVRLPDAGIDPAELVVGDGSTVREAWLDPPGESDPAHLHAHGTHADSLVLSFEEELDWPAFGLWLTMLLHARGGDILRVKGLLAVSGAPGPVAVHGVQHLVHPPAHLNGWPPEVERASRLVVIGRELDRGAILRSLRAFQALARGQRAAAALLRT